MARHSLKSIFAGVLATAAVANAEFDPCKFNFGTNWDNYSTSYRDAGGKVPKSSPLLAKAPAGLDYITIWLTEGVVEGSTQVAFNPYHHGTMLQHVQAQAKPVTPVFVSYIIAKLAFVDKGLKDCDMGSPNLCEGGAAYIQGNRDKILATYKAFALGMINADNVSAPLNAIWMLEPDFYQYVEHGLSASYAATLLGDIVKTVKSVQPDAKFSIDISPWANASTWYKNFDLTLFDYAHTSGGRTDGGSDVIKSANPGTTWSGINSVTGKPIIGDVGYGVGGASDPTNVSSWLNASNLNNRLKSGVIGVTRHYPDASWFSSAAALQGTLNKPSTCKENPVKKFALTLTPGTGGTISATPSATSYDSNTTVQLTATPATGYRFVSWGGAASGTNATTSVVMNAAKTVTATFAIKSTTKYTLTLAATTNGTISATPSGSIDSGVVVTLVATPAVGYKLAAWSGDATGTAKQTTVTMTGNKSVGATFEIDNTPVKLTVTAGANGSVALDPVMPTAGYTRGTKVTITATPASGYTLAAWSGAVSGNTNPLTVSVDSAMSISAVFRKPGEVSNLIKGGDGSSTTNWTLFANPQGPTLTSAADPKDAGNKVLSTKGNYGENSGDTAFMISQSDFQLSAGTTYYLSFRAMVSERDAARSAHPLGVRVLSGTSVAMKKSDSVVQDTSWHAYSYSFTPTVSGTGKLGFLLGNGGDRNWQSVLIDDVVLTDIPPVSVSRRTVVRTLNVKTLGHAIEFSMPVVEGGLDAEIVSVDGSTRNVLDVQVAAGAYRTAVSTADLRPGVYLLRVRNGWEMRSATFTIVK